MKCYSLTPSPSFFGALKGTYGKPHKPFGGGSVPSRMAIKRGGAGNEASEVPARVGLHLEISQGGAQNDD